MSKAEDKKVEDQDIAKLSDEEIQEALEEGKKLVQEDDLLDDEALEEVTIDSLQDEVNDLKDRLMRSLADKENLRKRSDKERREAELYGGTKLAKDLLSVYDNMGRALENIDDSLREQAKALIEGIELTQRELISIFNKHKIEKFHQLLEKGLIQGGIKLCLSHLLKIPRKVR